jgi:hypothetical protein
MDIWSLSLVKRLKVPIIHMLALGSWVINCIKHVRCSQENDKYEYKTIVYQSDTW